MLSIINRRVLVSSSTRPLFFVRSYSVIPSTPQQQNVSSASSASVTPDSTTSTNATDMFHSVHALYNNENQSIHESHLHTSSHAGGVTYHSLSEDDQHHSSTFGPTFNSVFDE